MNDYKVSKSYSGLNFKMIKKNLQIFTFILLLTACSQPSEPVFDNPYDEQSNAFISHPDLATLEVDSIRAMEAWSGGEFTNDYGNPVIAKGVCWSTEEKPTTNDSCTNDGGGLDPFQSHITDLEPEQTYYVRAYATNQSGTDYGEQHNFKTRNGIVQLNTTPVAEINFNTAQSGGEITDDGGATISERGICWNDTEYPTTSDFCKIDGAGIGSFNSNISNLHSNTTYYVRAYATNSVGTFYGNNKQFTTESHSSFIFTDNFSNNINNWNEFESDRGFARITSGNYHLRFLRPGYYRRSSNSVNNFIFEDNFSIEMTLQINSLLSSYSYFGFEWNLNFGETGTTHRQFSYSSDGSLWIQDRIDGGWTNNHSTLNTGFQFAPGSNLVLKIRKSESEYHISINGNSVGTISFNYPDLPMTNIFGIIFSSIEMSVDEIRITDHSDSYKNIHYTTEGYDQHLMNSRFDSDSRDNIPTIFID